LVCIPRDGARDEQGRLCVYLEPIEEAVSPDGSTRSEIIKRYTNGGIEVPAHVSDAIRKSLEDHEYLEERLGYGHRNDQGVPSFPTAAPAPLAAESPASPKRTAELLLPSSFPADSEVNPASASAAPRAEPNSSQSASSASPLVFSSSQHHTENRQPAAPSAEPVQSSAVRGGHTAAGGEPSAARQYDFPFLCLVRIVNMHAKPKYNGVHGRVVQQRRSNRDNVTKYDVILRGALDGMALKNVHPNNMVKVSNAHPLEIQEARLATFDIPDT